MNRGGGQAGGSGGGQAQAGPPQPRNNNDNGHQGAGAHIGSQAYLVGRFTGTDDYTILQFLRALETAKFLGNWTTHRRSLWPHYD